MAAATPEEVWGGNLESGLMPDLFNRREEAENLIAYLESVAGRLPQREDKKSFTIAIDARYGEGKTFFLKRLSDHLSLDHPVAYIDAWSEDITDDPLAAISATLKEALLPFIDSPGVRSKFSDFLDKAGKVAQIASIGLLKRSVSLLVTGGAVDAMGSVIAATSEDVGDVIRDGIVETQERVSAEVGEALKLPRAKAALEDRLLAHEAGKLAISSMKKSLTEIVKEIDGLGKKRPLVIIIDELDRCRPTYAIGILETIKHLFDVEGVVFILGTHTEQLGRAVGGIYGSSFDGHSYLRRFIDREYHLAEPPLPELLERLIKGPDLRNDQFEWPPLAISGEREIDPSLADFIAEYMKVYGMNARDAFKIVDILQTSVALVHRRKIYLPYFMPLIFGFLGGRTDGAPAEPVKRSQWIYIVDWTRDSGGYTEKNFSQVAVEIHTLLKSNPGDMNAMRLSGQRNNHIFEMASRYRIWNEVEQPIWAPGGYQRLLGAVARFRNPSNEEEG